jgi:hypothetical protein
MPISPSWHLTEGPQVYSFYPAASRSRRWQAICRIPWGREQWIVPLYVKRGFPWRPCVVDWEPDQRN